MLELFMDLFRDLPRLAPGSTDLTREAFMRATGGTPPGADGVVVDFGCGEGSATLELARLTPARILAIDLHEPYLATLASHAAAAGLADRIDTAVADLAVPGIAPGSVDLVWSEGAIYHAGFEEGLRAWRELLRPTGGVAVSELTWLTDTPAPCAQEFFAAAYPAMTSIDANLAAMRRAGLTPNEPLVFPHSAWEEGYYRPLEASFPAFLERHRDDERAQQVVAEASEEIAVFRACGDDYGYVFYTGRVA